MTPTPSNSWSGARVVVLGAGGFIGRWVAHALENSGAVVIACARDVEVMKRVAERWASSATLAEVDLKVAGALEALVGDHAPDVVFNLAGYGVDRSERDESTAAAINGALPERIVRAVATCESAWQGSRVVHVGSALEYGISSSDLAEDTEPQPTTLYGRTKLDGTLRLERASRELGVATVTGRLFTVFGAGEHEGRLLPTLLAAASSEETVSLSSGVQKRDFTWVVDVVDALLGLGRVGGIPGRLINVATGVLTPVRTFAERAAEVLGIDSNRLDFGAVDVRAEEMQHQPVATARLRALTGQAVPDRIEHGVRMTRDFLEGADHGR